MYLPATLSTPPALPAGPPGLPGHPVPARLPDHALAVVSDKAAMDKVLSRTPMLRVAEPIEVSPPTPTPPHPPPPTLRTHKPTHLYAVGPAGSARLSLGRLQGAWFCLATGRTALARGMARFALERPISWHPCCHAAAAGRQRGQVPVLRRRILHDGPGDEGLAMRRLAGSEGAAELIAWHANATGVGSRRPRTAKPRRAQRAAHSPGPAQASYCRCRFCTLMADAWP